MRTVRRNDRGDDPVAEACASSAYIKNDCTGCRTPTHDTFRCGRRPPPNTRSRLRARAVATSVGRPRPRRAAAARGARARARSSRRRGREYEAEWPTPRRTEQPSARRIGTRLAVVRDNWSRAAVGDAEVAQRVVVYEAQLVLAAENRVDLERAAVRRAAAELERAAALARLGAGREPWRAAAADEPEPRLQHERAVGAHKRRLIPASRVPGPRRCIESSASVRRDQLLMLYFERRRRSWRRRDEQVR